MMRKLVVFLVLLSTVFAACGEYVNSAVNYGPTCVYPQCFGAAQFYKEAAFCYANESNPDFNMDLARVYFQKAADYYIQNIVNLPSGGDYPLRAPSYEYAGDMKVQLGNYPVAKNYYDSAITEYMKVDNFAKVNEVKTKEATMGQTPVVPKTAEATTSQNLYLGAFFFIIAIIAITLFFFRRRTPPKEEFQPIRSEPSFKIEPEEPREQAKESAKEKMRDKIRKKYGLE